MSASGGPKKKCGSKVNPLGKTSGGACRFPTPRVHKLIIRKLPARNYFEENFRNFLSRCCCKLMGWEVGALDVASSTEASSALVALQDRLFTVEHFFEGSYSRAEGNISGCGFVSFKDANLLRSFLTQSTPFLATDDLNTEPEMGFAPFQKIFRQFDKLATSEACAAQSETHQQTLLRSDKMCGSFESDPSFAQFLSYEKENDTGAGKQLFSCIASVKHDPKNNPLLCYLRQKSHRLALEKKGARAKVSAAPERRNVRSFKDQGLVESKPDKGKESMEKNKKGRKISRGKGKGRGNGKGNAVGHVQGDDNFSASSIVIIAKKG